MEKSLVRALWLAALVTVPAAAESPRLLNENLFVDDNEGAEQRAHYLGYRFQPGLAGREDRFTAWVGRWQFDDPVGSEDFNVLRLDYAVPLSERTSFELRAAQLLDNDFTPTLGGVTLMQDLDRWHFELSADRELIDSVPGIREELTLDSYALSADYRISPQWTVVLAGLHQAVDDGNDRNGGVLRLIWQPAALVGFTLQARSRYIESDFDGVGYFSPPELEEHLLLFGYSRATAGDRWVLSVLAGPGRQRFEDGFGAGTRNDLFYAELKVRGWFTDRFGLEGRGFCSNSGGPVAGAPDSDYRYCSLLFSLIGVF